MKEKNVTKIAERVLELSRKTLKELNVFAENYEIPSIGRWTRTDLIIAIVQREFCK